MLNSCIRSIETTPSRETFLEDTAAVGNFFNSSACCMNVDLPDPGVPTTARATCGMRWEVWPFYIPQLSAAARRYGVGALTWHSLSGDCNTELCLSTGDLAFLDAPLLDLDLECRGGLWLRELDKAEGDWPPSCTIEGDDTVRLFKFGRGALPRKDGTFWAIVPSLEDLFFFDQPGSIIPLSHSLPSEPVPSCKTAFWHNLAISGFHHQWTETSDAYRSINRSRIWRDLLQWTSF